MIAEATKPQLHPSDLHTILACGEKFYRKKILGEREPAATHLVLGSSQHKVAYHDLTNLTQTGELLPDEQIQDLARDTFRQTWEELPILLDEEERAQGLGTVKGALTDMAIKVANLHHLHLAPTLRPAKDGLEFKWVLRSPDSYPYDLAGTVDVVEEVEFCDTLYSRIRDLKVVKQKPTQHELDQDHKETAYALAVQVIRGTPVMDVWRDALVKPTKTMGTRLFSLRSTRTDADLHSFLARMDIVMEAIQKGLFMPANPAEPWAPCHYCGFAATCRYYTKKPTVIPISSISSKKGSTHGHSPARTSTRRIYPGTDEWLTAISE